MGDLKGEPPEPDVVLTLVARGTWATRGIVGEFEGSVPSGLRDYLCSEMGARRAHRQSLMRRRFQACRL